LKILLKIRNSRS